MEQAFGKFENKILFIQDGFVCVKAGIWIMNFPVHSMAFYDRNFFTEDNYRLNRGKF